MQIRSTKSWLGSLMRFVVILFSQAAFVPSSESVLDTSYFTSRFSWNPSDEHVYAASEYDDSESGSTSGSSSCLSNRHDELVLYCRILPVLQNQERAFKLVIFNTLSYFIFWWNNDQGDECRGLAEFDSGSSVNYSFSNFSFKVSLNRVGWTSV